MTVVYIYMYYRHIYVLQAHIYYVHIVRVELDTIEHRVLTDNKHSVYCCGSESANTHTLAGPQPYDLH